MKFKKEHAAISVLVVLIFIISLSYVSNYYYTKGLEENLIQTTKYVVKFLVDKAFLSEQIKNETAAMNVVILEQESFFAPAGELTGFVVQVRNHLNETRSFYPDIYLNENPDSMAYKDMISYDEEIEVSPNAEDTFSVTIFEPTADYPRSFLNFTLAVCTEPVKCRKDSESLYGYDSFSVLVDTIPDHIE